MTKFRCIKGNSDIPVGTIIEGELEGKYIRLTKDSTVLIGEEPYFEKGETVRLTGYVWQWEQFDGPDKEELLARFEDAVRQNSSDYESAKAEVLKRLS